MSRAGAMAVVAIGALVALGAALAGCWRNTPVADPESSSPPPETATVRRAHPARTPCQLAIDHALEVSHDALDAQVLANIERARDQFVQSCLDTRWSADTIQCLQDALSSDEIGRCGDSMSSEQRSDIARKLGDLSQSP